MQKIGVLKTVFTGVAVFALNSKLRSKKAKVAEHYIKVIIQITDKPSFYHINAHTLSVIQYQIEWGMNLNANLLFKVKFVIPLVSEVLK